VMSNAGFAILNPPCFTLGLCWLMNKPIIRVIHAVTYPEHY
jgi:hypothetical protein